MAFSYAALESALKQRLRVIADRELHARDPRTHLGRLQSTAAELDRIVSELPADADPQLRHFLERQSYVKAVDWLDTHRGSDGSRTQSGS